MPWQVDEIPFLREVYRPEEEPEVDICFVHGLNPLSNHNHAYDTWTHKNGKFWPSDFLPDDVPTARVFVYGYNSNVAKEVSEARIKDHANVLLDRLQRKRRIRRQQYATTPIIFVGHSLGGLVIKQALLNARDDATYEPIKSSTYGLVFFGTPHRGGRNVQFGNLGAKVAKFISGDRADNDLISCLQANSLFTREATERFSHQLENYKIISFFETVPMRLGVKGIEEIVVDADSAVLNLPGSRERREALNADHSSMCKIGTKSDMYEGIVGKLQDMVDDALEMSETATAMAPSVAAKAAIIPSDLLSPERGLHESPRRHSSANLRSLPPADQEPDDLLSVVEANRRPVGTQLIEHDLQKREPDMPRARSQHTTSFRSRSESPPPPAYDLKALDLRLRRLDGLGPRNPVLESEKHGNKEQDPNRLEADIVNRADQEDDMLEIHSVFARAVFSFDAQLPGDLSFHEGQVITDIIRPSDESDQWWQGRIGERLGKFPANFVKILEPATKDLPPNTNSQKFQAMALFTYEAKQPLDLAFKKGEIISNITLPVDDKVKWWNGSIGNRSGIFPSNYVEILENKNATDTSRTNGKSTSRSNSNSAEVLSSQLSLQQQDSSPISVFQNTSQDTKSIEAAVSKPTFGVPDPIGAQVPFCSHCKLGPYSYPFWECQGCFGKTIICSPCNQGFLDGTLGKNPHASHQLKYIAAEYWFDARHFVWEENTIQEDEHNQIWGQKGTVMDTTGTTLGRTQIPDGQVIRFSPRPSSRFHFALVNVPAGVWEARFQISTWRSAQFGDAQLKQCGNLKSLGVRTGATHLGIINVWLGFVDDVEKWFTGEEQIRFDTAAPTSGCHHVLYGEHISKKLALVNNITVTDQQNVGVWIEWSRNSESFKKEKPYVQESLSFWWQLEGIRFIGR